MGFIVIPLPDPSLAVTRTNEEHGAPHSITQYLNDDILREIANYLEWTDQVALSTTSRHIHQLDLPCLRQCVCNTTGQLQDLYKYLTVDTMTSSRCIARLRSLRLVCADRKTVLGKGSTSKLLQMVKDILRITATSLRHLEFSKRTAVPSWEAGLLLKHLTHVRYVANALPKPGTFPESLCSLHIGGDKKRMTFPIRQLFLHLAHLPALLTLVLDVVDIEESGDSDVEADSDNSDNSDSIASFPTIHTLRFLHCRYSMDDITEPPLSEIFPNLSTLEVTGEPMSIEEMDSATEHHLSSLILDSFETVIPNMWSVDHITYTNPNMMHNVFNMHEVANCDGVVSFRLRTDLEDPFFQWEDLASAFSTLRLLEVESYKTSVTEIMGLLVSRLDSPGRRQHGSPSLFIRLCVASRTSRATT